MSAEAIETIALAATMCIILLVDILETKPEEKEEYTMATEKPRGRSKKRPVSPPSPAPAWTEGTEVVQKSAGTEQKAENAPQEGSPAMAAPYRDPSTLAAVEESAGSEEPAETVPREGSAFGEVTHPATAPQPPEVGQITQNGLLRNLVLLGLCGVGYGIAFCGEKLLALIEKLVKEAQKPSG